MAHPIIGDDELQMKKHGNIFPDDQVAHNTRKPSVYSPKLELYIKNLSTQLN